MNPKPEGEGIIALRVHPKIRQRGDPFRVPTLVELSCHRIFSRIIIRVSRISTSNWIEVLTEKRQYENLPRVSRASADFLKIYIVLLFPKYLAAAKIYTLSKFLQNLHVNSQILLLFNFNVSSVIRG